MFLEQEIPGSMFSVCHDTARQQSSVSHKKGSPKTHPCCLFWLQTSYHSGKISFCCLSFPFYSILLWHPKITTSFFTKNILWNIQFLVPPSKTWVILTKYISYVWHSFSTSSSSPTNQNADIYSLWLFTPSYLKTSLLSQMPQFLWNAIVYNAVNNSNMHALLQYNNHLNAHFTSPMSQIALLYPLPILKSSFSVLFDPFFVLLLFL